MTEADLLRVTEVMATEWCRSCDTRQPLADLTEVVTVRTGDTFYVCRPSRYGQCFRRGVASVYVHRVRQMVPPDPATVGGQGVIEERYAR